MQAITLGMKTLLNNHELTPYERGVIEAMLEVAILRGSLSEKQISFYENIASNYTENALTERRAWEASFDEARKKDLKIVASYYSRQGTYFLGLANRVLEEEGFIPTRKAFAKMCENKYAKRLLSEHYKKPKYGIGDVVYAVTKCPGDVRKTLCRGAVVLRPSVEPPVSAVRGAKQYLVLPIGEPHGIVIEERWLKSRRDKTNGAKANEKKRKS
jgi:hypothetical protein